MVVLFLKQDATDVFLKKIRNGFYFTISSAIRIFVSRVNFLSLVCNLEEEERSM